MASATYGVNARRGRGCYFFEGAALAFMVLAHRVPWKEKPRLTQALYDDLFRKGLGYRVHNALCVTRGDALSEVVVERVT